MKAALLTLCLAATCACAPSRATVLLESRGVSMLPSFPPHCLVAADPSVPYESLRPGMVVTYLNAFRGQITHRLIRLTPHGWVTKGDNNEVCDRGLMTRMVRGLP